MQSPSGQGEQTNPTMRGERDRMMRQCPECNQTFYDGIDVCPADGRTLMMPDPRLGRIVDGKYRIEARLGGGGQGTVYRATHVHLQRSTALKILRGDFVGDPEAFERFRREALVLARLKHPNIVGVHDFGLEPEMGAYLVMEYLDGRTARQELRRHTRLPVGVAVGIARDVCAALHAAHAQGVIHRDVKPENIVLEALETGEVVAKVLDFGIAKLYVEAEADSGVVTEAGRVLGTPAYMSPEQCNGLAPDARSDVYSLGCVLYELLTGATPFASEGLMKIMQAHLYTRPLPPSMLVRAIPPELSASLLKALAKRPEDRFATAAEFAVALSSVPFGDVAPGGETGTLNKVGVDDDSDMVTLASDEVEAGAPSSPQPPNNLPQEVTSFVGREREVDEVSSQVAASRLLTLTGPGGGGKTRLSIRVATDLMPQYRDGVWLVELAPIKDAALVPSTVASVLGVREEPDRSLTETLVSSLASRSLLLVLDNCEHLVEACARFAATVIQSCPNVRIIATSQEALSVSGERLWAVQPLSIADASEAETLEGALASDAVRLFVDRASMHDARFELTTENVAAVVHICKRLDGIPLALELAAARIKLLTAEQIAERLDDRFRLLTTGGRLASDRQRTLKGALDWSYELLTESERTVFKRLSVFVGGFTIEAVEVVAACDEIDGYEALDLLARLVDKSLVVNESAAGESRYRMLETILKYGRARLDKSGTADGVLCRHRDFYHAIAEHADAQLSGPAQAAWLDRLDVEHGNLRGALEYCRRTGAFEQLVRLANALSKFWYVRGHEREASAWFAAGLVAAETLPDRLVARAQVWMGAFEGLQRNYARAAEHIGEGLATWRRLGDDLGVATALNQLGFVAQWEGDFAAAEALHGEALLLARTTGDRVETATALNNLGVVARSRGELDDARELFEESLAIFRNVGDKRSIASTINNLSVVVAIGGDIESAAVLQEEHLRLRRQLADRRGLAAALTNLGEIMQLRKEYASAHGLLSEALKLCEQAGDRRAIATTLESFISLAVDRNDARLAMRLSGAAAALRESIGSPLAPSEADELERHLAHARSALDEAAADLALQTGRMMTIEQAIESALETST